MDSYHEQNDTIQKKTIDSNTGVAKGNESTEEPPPKRKCTAPMEQPDVGVELDGFRDGNMNDRSLPIPTIHVDQINVRQPGSVNHEYGNGHHQMNITHCATTGNQQDITQLGLPTLFVQPNYEERQMNSQKFDRQVVSYDSNT